MAFPTVAAQNARARLTTDSDVFASDLGSPSAGHLLLVFVSLNTTGAAPTTPSGWSVLANQLGTSTDRFVSYWRVAAGSDTFDYGSAVGVDWAYSCFCIADWHGSAAPEISTSDTGGTVTTTPDGPSLSPSWGSADTLWISALNYHLTTGATSPTGYSTAVAAGSASRGTASAYKTNAASSEDPSTWTLAAARHCNLATVAVRPVASAAKGGIIIAQQLEILGGGVL